MALYLIAYSILQGRRASIPGSYVMDLPEAPTSLSDLDDINADVSLMHGTQQVALFGWDLLFDRTSHPAGTGEVYPYFLTCQVVHHNGRHGLTSAMLTPSYPISTLNDVREVEGWLRKEGGAESVHLLSCKPLCSASTRPQ